MKQDAGYELPPEPDYGPTLKKPAVKPSISKSQGVAEHDSQSSSHMSDGSVGPSSNHGSIELIQSVKTHGDQSMELKIVLVASVMLVLVGIIRCMKRRKRRGILMDPDTILPRSDTSKMEYLSEQSGKAGDDGRSISSLLRPSAELVYGGLT